MLAVGTERKALGGQRGEEGLVLGADRAVQLDPRAELRPQALYPLLQLLGSLCAGDRVGQRAAQKRRMIAVAEPALQVARFAGAVLGLRRGAMVNPASSRHI